MIALLEPKRISERTEGSSASIGLEKRVLEFRKAPSAAGSGYLGYVELYLDGEYEGYVAIPRLGGPQVMIYGRSQMPEARDSGENRERVEDSIRAPSSSGAGGIRGKASALAWIRRLWEVLRRRQGS
jgi:hypothetical protein